MSTSQRKVEGGGLRHLVHFLHQFSCPILSFRSEDSVQDAPHPHPALGAQAPGGRGQPTCLGSCTMERLVPVRPPAPGEDAATRGPATD